MSIRIGSVRISNEVIYNISVSKNMKEVLTNDIQQKILDKEAGEETERVGNIE